MKVLPKYGKTLDYSHYEKKEKELFNNFPIGLLILEKEELDYKINQMNSYVCDIFELYQDSDFSQLKNKMKQFKKWENNSLQEINLYHFIFEYHFTKEHCGTFISSLSMIYVKIKYNDNLIFLSIDNYNDERKDLQGNLVKSLKYQYLVTLYHELNNPLNALMNMSDDYNVESLKKENKDLDKEEIEVKFKQINLLVILIKMFIKNFIWYFRVIFELSNNIEPNTTLKINLEFLFSKNVNKYKELFKYKEITYENNYLFLRDKFILSDGKHINNFLKGIFVYLYHVLPKKNGFTIDHIILKDEKIKLNFIKVIKNITPSKGRRRSKILDDIEFNFKKEFNFSRSVQTIEITKELLLRLSNMLNLKLKFHNDNEDIIISLILPFSYEKLEIIEEDDIKEFTPQQKLIALNGINRTIPISNNWNTLINENHIEILETSSPFQTSLTTMQNNNYHLSISVPNDNYLQYGNCLLSTNSNSNQENNENKNKNKTEQNDIFKLENDPFIKMTKEQNPFSRELVNSKLNDSFISGSNSISEVLTPKDEEEKVSFNNYLKKNFSFYTYNPQNYQKVFEINFNLNPISNKKSITYEKENKNRISNIIYNNEEENNKKINRKTNVRKTEKNLKIENIKVISKFKHQCNSCNDVLLCDDEEFNLSTIKNMLKKYSINVDTSTNGKECIDAILKKKKLNCLCKKRNYKLLFLDMMMPIMDGLETTKRIQDLINKNEINDNLKIIIVSAHIEDNLIKSLKEFKCVVEEVPKPLKKSKLEEILNKYYK